MKFRPCINECTTEGTFCQGCGRSHEEINESKALVGKVVAHLTKYGYDDPENFLAVLNKKSLTRYAQLKQESCK